MDALEKQVRERFRIPADGKICESCMDKYMKKIRIDELLHKNAKAQADLGIDSTAEEKQKALDVAKYVKKSISMYDKEFADSAFPEINIDDEHSN